MDISDPTKPDQDHPRRPVHIHDVASNADGTRLYGALFAPVNGLIILDVSDIQKRIANPAIREVSRLTWTGRRRCADADAR